MVSRILANSGLAELEQIAGDLGALADDLLKVLESHIKQSNMGANGANNEHHIQNSNPKPPIDLEPASKKAGPRHRLRPLPNQSGRQKSCSP